MTTLLYEHGEWSTMCTLDSLFPVKRVILPVIITPCFIKGGNHKEIRVDGWELEVEEEIDYLCKIVRECALTHVIIEVEVSTEDRDQVNKISDMCKVTYDIVSSLVFEVLGIWSKS